MIAAARVQPFAPLVIRVQPWQCQGHLACVLLPSHNRILGIAAFIQAGMTLACNPHNANPKKAFDMIFTTRFLATTLTAALLAAPALAQTSDHSGHDMKQMDHSKMNSADMKHGDMKHGDMDHESMDQGSMDHDAMMKARSEHMIEATGVVEKIYKKDGLVSLSHDAIPAISWPPMTMKFPVGDKIDLDSLKKGQTVQFTLHRAQDGSLPLVELCPTESPAVIVGLCASGMNHGPDGTMIDHKDMQHGDMKHDGGSHDGMKH